MLMYRMPYIISLCQNKPLILILASLLRLHYDYSFPAKLHPLLSIFLQ